MASPTDAPNPHNTQRLPATHLSRSASNSRALERGSIGGVGVQTNPDSSRPLRRGHSDGDVLCSHLQGFRGDRRSGEESWMDILGGSSRPSENADISSRRHLIRNMEVQGPSRRQERQAVMQRAAFMLADRKRRLVENQEEHSRRRSASSLPFVSPLNDQRSENLQTSRTGPSFATPELPERIFRSISNDRPLPRRSHNASTPNRQSREITLPRWQPDSEVTSCPICGTSFGFWFRKHHCRKCGRVVCANCSPHRITIPRQFIVQPPQDLIRTSSSGTPASIDVVDLTDDQDVETPESQRSSADLDTPQSPQLSIDPALGGGQEVRLCNPCVPDPNPLPHLPFESPIRHGIHSFPRPEFGRPGIPSNAPPHFSQSNVPRRSSSARNSSHQLGQNSFRMSNEAPSQESGIGPSIQHNSTALERSRLQANHPQAYGSVPARSLHDVSRLSIFSFATWTAKSQIDLLLALP